jgi:hypothetical protein
MDAVARLIHGAVDLHVHPSPSLFPRRIDEVEAARLADDAQMRAILVKSHHHSTAPDLLPLRKHVFSDLAVQVFGGVPLNSYTGGLNPYVVDLTLRMGGRMVWFPTISSENHIRHHQAEPDLKFPKQEQRELPEVPIRVIDERGELLPAAREILRLIAEADAMMSPGHVSVEEVFALLHGAREAGVKRILVNHPEFVIEASEAQVQEFARLGAYIEHSLCMYHPDSIFYLWTTERLARWIDIVGPERTVLGSDLGQTNNPLPVEGMRALAQDLLDRGVREADLELMIKRNPAWLLGLEE